MTNIHENNILIVAFSFPPSANVGVHRTLRFARFLPLAGWHPAVLTSVPLPGSPQDATLTRMVPNEVVVKQVPLRRTEDILKQRLAKAWRMGSTPHLAAKEATTTLNRTAIAHTGISLGNSANTAGCVASADRPVAAVSQSQVSTDQEPTAQRGRKWKSQFTELLFAIPDNRIGWKKDAVRAGLELIGRLHTKVIFASGPPFSTLVVGRALARASGLPLVLDFRDPWTRVPWGPRNKSSLANRLAARWEQLCVAAADRVILNTPHLQQDFIHHYRSQPQEKFICIPNGFDPEIKLQVDALNQQHSEQPYSDLQNGDSQNGKMAVTERPCTIMHPGSLYRNRDPRPLIDALALLKARGVKVLFEQLGTCECPERVMEYAQERSVTDYLRISPAVPHAELLVRMQRADAFLLLQPGTALQVPGKLFEMILFRKPIVAVCPTGALSEIVQKYNIGSTAAESDVTQIADAIQRAVTTPPSDGQWDAVQQAYDGQRLAGELAQLCTDICKSKR